MEYMSVGNNAYPPSFFDDGLQRCVQYRSFCGRLQEVEEASRNGKTQDNFKIHFTTSHHEIQETIHNSHATGYSANFMSDKGIKETENEMVTSLAKLATTETAEKQVIKNQQQ